MENINIKYLKDENNNIISPVTSTDSIFDPQGGGVKSFVIDLIYPIGSIYISVNETNPNLLFGGEWEQLKDRFLLGKGDTYTTLEKIGGESEHTLTKAELPKLSGTFKISDNVLTNTTDAARITNTDGIVSVFKTSSNRAYTGSSVSSSTSVNDSVTISFGSNTAHNNMPPYIVVFMYKRIS